MQIRRTAPDDWAQLKALRLAALTDAPTAFGVRHADAAAEPDSRWQARAAGTLASYWLACAGDAAVGMAGAVTADNGRRSLIGMWVAPAWRGAGVAAQLVAAVKADAVAHGHAQLFLDVAPDNARAARFYTREGFLFIDEWAPLASHPQITVQTMVWPCR